MAPTLCCTTLRLPAVLSTLSIDSVQQEGREVAELLQVISRYSWCAQGSQGGGSRHCPASCCIIVEEAHSTEQAATQGGPSR